MCFWLVFAYMKASPLAPSDCGQIYEHINTDGNRMRLDLPGGQ